MRVLLVGDTHANTAWLTGAVIPAAPCENADLILQLGDSGWWPGQPAGDAFIDTARRSPVPLSWINGNYEHHDDLAQRRQAAGPEGWNPLHLGGNLTYLQRGARIDLEGVHALGCGGAHSIDRQLRNPGRSWFEAERITECAVSGRADILFSHDAPGGWDIPGMIPDEVLPPRCAPNSLLAGPTAVRSAKYWRRPPRRSSSTATITPATQRRSRHPGVRSRCSSSIATTLPTIWRCWTAPRGRGR